jgi:hypothetical protein
MTHDVHDGDLPFPVDPFVAVAIGVPHQIQGYRFYGTTPKEARDRLINSVQKYMDEEYTNLTVTELEIAPATVDRFA